MGCENVMCICHNIAFKGNCNYKNTNKAVEECPEKQIYDSHISEMINEKGGAIETPELDKLLYTNKSPVLIAVAKAELTALKSKPPRVGPLIKKCEKELKHYPDPLDVSGLFIRGVIKDLKSIKKEA